MAACENEQRKRLNKGTGRTNYVKKEDKESNLPIWFEKDIENTINHARDFINETSSKLFISRKEYKLWQESRLALLDETFQTFNNLEKNIMNLIDEKKQDIKKEVIEQLEKEKEGSKLKKAN